MKLIKRIEGLDWQNIETSLSREGVAITPALLDGDERADCMAWYDQASLFRSRINMERYNYGRGEYQYFKYPLPERVALMRRHLYQKLAPIANNWQEALRMEERYPATLDEYSQICHAAGQVKPTPLILRYGEGDYNCLHQDLYGEHAFPIQVAILLSEPERDFEGGELVFVEQRPRMQSRPRVVSLKAGQGVIFAVRFRPQKGPRGYHRVTLKHGVSQLHRGARYTLGMIFHDAQ